MNEETIKSYTCPAFSDLFLSDGVLIAVHELIGDATDKQIFDELAAQVGNLNSLRMTKVQMEDFILLHREKMWVDGWMLFLYGEGDELFVMDAYIFPDGYLFRGDSPLSCGQIWYGYGGVRIAVPQPNMSKINTVS